MQMMQSDEQDYMYTYADDTALHAGSDRIGSDLNGLPAVDLALAFFDLGAQQTHVVFVYQSKSPLCG